MKYLFFLLGLLINPLNAQWRPIHVTSNTDVVSIEENFKRASLYSARKLDRFSNDTVYGQPIFYNGIKFLDNTIQTTAISSTAYVKKTGDSMSGGLYNSSWINSASSITATNNIYGTIGTAAQPNITSLGTLTGLSVSSNTTTVNFPGSGIWNASGNVGIGNLAPKAKLSLGVPGSPAFLAYSDGGIHAGWFYDVPYSGNQAITTWYGGDLVFGKTTNNTTPTFGTEFIHIKNATGNVGIGIAAPLAKLSLGVPGSPAFLTYSAADIHTGWFYDVPNATDQTIATWYGGDLVFGKTAANTTPTFGTELMRIKNAGGLRVPIGNVGIGVAAPTAKLEIAGNVISTGTLVIQGAADSSFVGNVAIGIANAGGVALSAVGDSTFRSAATADYNTLELNSVANNPQQIFTSYAGANAEAGLQLGVYSKKTAIHISPVTGYIAISSATPSPAVALDVSGFTRLGDNANAPKIKMVKVSTETSSNAGDYAQIAHGVTASKIIGAIFTVDVLGSGFAVGPNVDEPANWEYNSYYDNTYCVFRTDSANSASIRNKPATCTIFYIE